MLPSMIQQITAASMPRPAERANTRKLRQENILMMMLGRNFTALDLSRHYKKSLRMIAAAPTMYEYIASSASNGCAEARKIMEAINAGR